MRSASRLVIVALSMLFLALPALPASATPQEDDVVVAAQQTTEPTQPGSTAPAGPKLEPADTEAQAAERKRKIVMGVASAILVGIVVWGRSVKRKRAKA